MVTATSDQQHRSPCSESGFKVTLSRLPLVNVILVGTSASFSNKTGVPCQCILFLKITLLRVIDFDELNKV